jgi:hypothetical protein
MDAKRELNVPPDVETNGGTELLRLFVSEGALSLTMQRGFEKPEVWGQLLAKLAHHVSTVYDRETPIGGAKALSEIIMALDVSLGRKAAGVASIH